MQYVRRVFSLILELAVRYGGECHQLARVRTVVAGNSVEEVEDGSPCSDGVASVRSRSSKIGARSAVRPGLTASPIRRTTTTLCEAA